MPGCYREHPPPAATRDVVACLWERVAPERHEQRVVPDGCVDLVWLAGRELVFAGADTTAHSHVLPAGSETTGLRLRTGAAGAVLGVPADELRDLRVPAEAVWGERARVLADALGEAPAARRPELLAAAVAERHVEPDRLVLAAAARLRAGHARVATVAGDLGVSERTLHRRTVAAVGYGPKVLARVARLRRLVTSDEPTLAGRAYLAGYASQAHMGDEVRRLTGDAPVRFLEDAGLTAA